MNDQRRHLFLRQFYAELVRGTLLENTRCRAHWHRDTDIPIVGQDLSKSPSLKAKMPHSKNIVFFWKKNTFCFVFKVDVILPIIKKKNQNALQIDWTSRIMLCAIYLWKAKQKVMIYEEFWQMVMGSPDPYVCCSRSAVKHCNGNVQPTLGVARAAVHGAASDSLFM